MRENIYYCCYNIELTNTFLSGQWFGNFWYLVLWGEMTPERLRNKFNNIETLETVLNIVIKCKRPSFQAWDYSGLGIFPKFIPFLHPTAIALSYGLIIF